MWFLRGITRWGEAVPAGNAGAIAISAGTSEEFVTENEESITYRLTFPSGEPVKVGELQKWLDLLRADPEVTDEEFVVAAGIVKSLRAHLN
jgi:hypothetical protein